MFERSRHAMVVADDERRFVDANQAACSLLRTSRERLLTLTVDDITPPELRGEVGGLWRKLMDQGTGAGSYELLLPDGGRLRTEYSATASIVPGRHLSIFIAHSDLEPDGEPEREEPLTRREREVLQHVALGAGTREIADRLVVSPDTARTHARNAMRKLGARNRAHAVALAIKRELIDV